MLKYRKQKKKQKQKQKQNNVRQVCVLSVSYLYTVT